MGKYGYLDRIMSGEQPSTRARSKKQESKIAKDLSGHTTINSGATFGQNDVLVDFCEVEAKTTGNDSFSFKLSDWRKLCKKCNQKKMPIFVIDFEKTKNSLAVLKYDDLMYLIEKANAE
jgi:hypothetical protein